MELTTKHATEDLSFDKVWFMFQETDRKFQETKELLANSSLETEKMFQETDRKFQETKELLANSSLETNRKFQETKELLASSSLETNRKFQETKELLANSSLETDKKFQATDYTLKKLMKKSAEYDSRWGRFVESLVEGSLVRLLNDRNIMVNDTMMRRKKHHNDRDYEIDIIALNGSEIVVVEVKTTLSTSDVSKFLELLSEFRIIFEDYKEKNVIGAVAYIGKDSGADSFASSHGLFVIKATGESARITNPEKFTPRRW